ncbi:hypothetical protein HMI54_003324 [Coelomomyces lativittatus]|nr:hypothetical protein HMI56_000252 [Coelomomyces lativittatus]KAJ1508302.1 hypothetical protein HMI54_003324 [Coelomomyces lativittatus]KAJ1512855.1 hypothetical protein HMI55_006082 [Coelomomyces lativittatus]
MSSSSSSSISTITLSTRHLGIFLYYPIQQSQNEVQRENEGGGEVISFPNSWLEQIISFLNSFSFVTDNITNTTKKNNGSLCSFKTILSVYWVWQPSNRQFTSTSNLIHPKDEKESNLSLISPLGNTHDNNADNEYPLNFLNSTLIHKLAQVYVTFLSLLPNPKNSSMTSSIQVQILLHGYTSPIQQWKNTVHSLLELSPLVNPTSESSYFPFLSTNLASASSLVLSQRFSQVVVGGTFDHCHEGHRLLLTVAGMICSTRLLCGITQQKSNSNTLLDHSGKMEKEKTESKPPSTSLLQHKQYSQFIEPYQIRVQNVESFLNQAFPNLTKIECVPLLDPYGPSIHDPNLEALVVTTETHANALQVNSLRIQSNLKPLTIIVVPIISKSSIEKDPSCKLSSTTLRQHLDSVERNKIISKTNTYE